MLTLVSEITFNRKRLDEALETAKDRKSRNEAAIDTNGMVWIMTKNGVTKKSVDKIGKGDRVMTVNDLAQMRAYSPDLAFDKGEATATIAGSDSVANIAKLIQDTIEKIGYDTEVREQFVKKGGQARKIAEGIDELLGDSDPEALKKVGTRSKDLTEGNIKAAIKWIAGQLNDQQIALLALHAKKRGTSVEEMIKDCIGYQYKPEHELTLSGGKDVEGEGESVKSNLEQNPLMNYLSGMNGIDTEFEFNPGTSAHMTAPATMWAAQDVKSGERLGQTSFEEFLNRTGIIGETRTNGVCVGSQYVDMEQYKNMMTDGKLMRTFLPAVSDGHGGFKPNLDLVDDFVKTYKAIKAANGNPTLIKRALASSSVREYFTADGKVDEDKCRLFIAVNVYADSDENSWTNGWGTMPWADKGVLSSDNRYLRKVEDQDGIERNMKSVLGDGKDGRYKWEKHGDLMQGVAYIDITGANAQSAVGMGSGNYGKSGLSNNTYRNDAQRKELEEEKSAPQRYNRGSKSVLTE